MVYEIPLDVGSGSLPGSSSHTNGTPADRRPPHNLYPNRMVALDEVATATTQATATHDGLVAATVEHAQQQQQELGGTAGMRVPEVSTIRICCLYNRSRQFWKDSNKKKKAKKAKNEENGNGAEDVHTSVSESPLKQTEDVDIPGDNDESSDDEFMQFPTPQKKSNLKYYRAVKIAAMGTSVNMLRGKQYIFVAPHMSPITELKKRTVSVPASSENADLRNLLSSFSRNSRRKASSASTSSNPTATAARRKREEKFATLAHQSFYPYDEFDHLLLQENTPRGRCGLYELQRIEGVDERSIQRRWRDPDSFIVCLSEPEAKLGDKTATDDSEISTESQTPHSNSDQLSSSASSLNQNLMNDVASSADADHPLPMKDSDEAVKDSSANQTNYTSKKEPLILPCRCEIVKRRALMHAELLTLLLKRTMQAHTLAAKPFKSRKGKEKATDISWWNEPMKNQQREEKSIWLQDEIEDNWMLPVSSAVPLDDQQSPYIQWRLELMQTLSLNLCQHWHLLPKRAIGSESAASPFANLTVAEWMNLPFRDGPLLRPFMEPDNFQASSLSFEQAETELKRRIKLFEDALKEQRARVRLFQAIARMMEAMQRLRDPVLGSSTTRHLMPMMEQAVSSAGEIAAVEAALDEMSSYLESMQQSQRILTGWRSLCLHDEVSGLGLSNAFEPVVLASGSLIDELDG